MRNLSCRAIPRQTKSFRDKRDPTESRASRYTGRSHRMCAEANGQSMAGGSQVDRCLLRVMTFNVRGAFHKSDGINAWVNRSVLNVETIKRHAPDLIGFQELQSGNLDTYEELSPQYELVLGPEYGNEARPS